MYETEANARIESSNQIPPEILSAFAGLSGKILTRTVLPWGEHCTECVWPTCYTSCELYSPREDGRCRRFVDGMVRIDCPAALNHYLLKVRFKQWGKLWTPGNLRLRSVDESARIERWDYRVGTILYQLPMPASVRKTVTDKRYGMKKRAALRSQPREDTPTSFLLECFNPLQQSIGLSFTVRSFNTAIKIPFQKLLVVEPGFQTVRIPFAELSQTLNLDSPFNVEIIPNEIGKEITLYFGLMDFVREARPESVATEADAGSNKNEKKIKCVVWDLDNTLWDGILVESGVDNLHLKSEVVEVIRELDRRGILNSIASKNNPDEAMRALRQFQIADLFLCPQISWNPKSQALAAIAAQLNIGGDSLLFVDDSEFERREVEAACPEVRVLDAQHSATILQMEACDVPVTSESLERRKMYQVEKLRQDLAGDFKDDYKKFLQHCEIRLHIQPLSETNLERVHELTQRTNQMNFSGNRYDREVLKKILSNSALDTYVLSCEDRFGSYGIVGFGIVDNREPRLTDLMFSCRVQSKRVEHAFLVFILRKYIAVTGNDFHANYRKTPRNLPAGQVFADLGMQEQGVRDGVTALIFSKGEQIPDDGIIQIVQENAHPVQQ